MKALLSTGEAAKILGISRSTVSRKFDQGILEGKRNPITGERWISRESVEKFLEQYNIPIQQRLEEPRTVVLVTARDKIRKWVYEALGKNERFRVTTMEFGTDALVYCAKEPVALLILDESLPDIPPVEVARSLFRQQEAANLRVLFVGEETASPPVERSRMVDPEGTDAERLRSLVEEMLGLQEQKTHDLPPLHEERRSAPRIPMHLPVRFDLYPITRPEQVERGRGILSNLSRGGACITGMRTERGVLPAETFHLRIHASQEPLKDWSAECKVVRLQSNGFLTAGLQFLSLTQANRNKMEELLESMGAA